MTAANFDRLYRPLMGIEGGVADRPKKADPGGLTNFGVTQKTYDRYRAARGLVRRSVREIEADEVRDVAKEHWDSVRGDELPSGLDWAMFDFAYNSGPAQPIKELQRVLGCNVDGQLGPATLHAVEVADTIKTIEHLCDRRLAFMKSLRNWKYNAKGWTRRVAEVRGKALFMAVERQAPDRPESPPSPLPASATAKAEPVAQAKLKTAEGQGLTLAGAGVGGEKVRQFAESVQPHMGLETVLGRLAFAVFTLLMLIGGVLIGYAYIRRIKEAGGLGGFIGSVFK